MRPRDRSALRRQGSRCLLFAILMCASGGGAPRAEPQVAASPDDLVAAITRLERSLAGIDRTLERIQRDQRALLIATWIETEQRRLVPLEEDLRRAREEKKEKELEAKVAEQRLASAERAVQEGIRQGDDAARTRGLPELDALRSWMESMRAAAQGADTRIAELEAELAGPRRDLERLRARLLDLLDEGED